MLSSWIVFLLIGRLFIYLWQQIPLPASLGKYRAIEKLHQCDLCSGVWIYGILSLCTGLSLWEILGFQSIPIVSQGVTGGVCSFLMWLLVAGWNEKFNNILVIG